MSADGTKFVYGYQKHLSDCTCDRVAMTGWRGSVIVVATLAANLLLSGQSAAQSATVRGRLVDEQGQAIDGVHVTLRETGPASREPTKER